MHLREHVRIRATAADVWPWVADPSWHARWNPNVSDVRRPAGGAARFGERFAVTWSGQGRAREHRVTVTECRPTESVAFRYEGEHDGRPQVTTVAYRLRPCRGGVRVTQSVDLSGAGLGRGWRVVVWLISRFGTPTEKPMLHRLRDAVEGRSQSVETGRSGVASQMGRVGPPADDPYNPDHRRHP